MEKCIDSFDGTRIFYYDNQLKSDKVAVFLHGWAGNRTHWKGHFDFFTNKGFRVIAPDFRGFGKSDCPKEEEKYSFKNDAKDINEILIKEKISNACFLGFSMGGMIALTFSSSFPEKASSLVFAMSGHKGPLQNQKLKNYAFKLTNMARKHPFKKINTKEVDFYKDNYAISTIKEVLSESSTMGVIVSLENILNFDFSKNIGKISVPALIIAGAKDGMMPKKISKEMQSLLKQSQYVEVNYDHFFIVKHPDVSSLIILDFLEK